MTLVQATEGCCKGHRCDNCATCKKGRCCRKDNPQYSLPGLGEWDGRIYGELGVLNDDGEKVECHCCGEWFVSLGHHVLYIHDLTPKEYKSIFGLRLSEGLVSPERHATLGRSHADHLVAARVIGHPLSPIPHYTPEQRSDFGSRGQNSRTRFQPGHATTKTSWKQGVKRSVSTSRYVGVSWHTSHKKWRAQLTTYQGGKQVHALTKYFATEEEAARAYDAKARELYGDQARLNFPDDAV